MVRISLVLFPADSDQVHNLPKNRHIDRIDVNRLRKNYKHMYSLSRLEVIEVFKNDTAPWRL